MRDGKIFKIPWDYSKKIFFSKHLNKVIIATILLILRIWVVLNTSVASMTSTVLITSLASMTSTASLASKNQKQPALYLLSDFPCIRNLSGLNDLYSLNNLGGLNDLLSLISSKNYWAWCFHQPWHQNDFLMWDGSSKTQCFIDFWHIFFWRLWRTGMLLLTKSKGHK